MITHKLLSGVAGLLLVLTHGLGWSGEDASTAGALKADPPTLISLGLSWHIKGDANENATVGLSYRKAGAKDWVAAFPLTRAYDGDAPKGIKSARSYFFKVGLPAGTWRFAGSVWDLESDTEYELQVSLKDPDGGDVQKVVKIRTRPEPKRLGGGRELYVAPPKKGATNGDGTEGKPFIGLGAAQKAAQPGDTIWLKAGVYKGSLKIVKNGAKGKPIVFRGMPGDAAIIDGSVSVGGKRFITFDTVTFKGGGISAGGASNITIRYCIFRCPGKNLHARDSRNFYVADNDVKGSSTWPRTKGIEGTAGFDIGGSGHAVCFNRVRGVADGISCLRGKLNIACDFYNNDISECTDDGVEADYTHWNLRVFRNRLTNVYQALSCQPIKGGPVYVFRNVVYNTGRSQETFKLHNYCSGMWFVHNTTMKLGTALHVGTREFVTNAHFYNNLFIGQGPGKGLRVNFGVTLRKCSFDYNGVGGAGFTSYIRWNKKWLGGAESLKKDGPVQQHGELFLADSGKMFAGDIKPPTDDKKQYEIKVNDLRLHDGAPAVDKAKVMPGFNDGFVGKAPDMGALEFGKPVPHYGPRPQEKK